MRHEKFIGLFQTGRHIRKVRSQQGIRLSEMARLVGYGNVNREVQRLHVFESEGIISEELLEKVAETLAVPLEDLQRLVDLDRQDSQRRFEEWCSKSEPPHLVIRLIPGVYQRVWVPVSVPSDWLEQYAATTATEREKQTCLVMNRRESVWFDEDEGLASGRQRHRTSPCIIRS